MPLRANGGDCRRPHRLDHHLAGCHQVDALVERLPEGTELAGLLGLDQEGDGLVDLGAGHVALVDVFHRAERFHHHGGIHDADTWDVEDCRLALERWIDKVLPVPDRPADQIRANAEGVGVVDCGYQRRPFGGMRGELRRGLALDEGHGVRRGALRDLRRRRELAGGEDRHDLVEQLDASWCPSAAARRWETPSW